MSALGWLCPLSLRLTLNAVLLQFIFVFFSFLEIETKPFAVYNGLEFPQSVVRMFTLRLCWFVVLLRTLGISCFAPSPANAMCKYGRRWHSTELSYTHTAATVVWWGKKFKRNILFRFCYNCMEKAERRIEYNFDNVVPSSSCSSPSPSSPSPVQTKKCEFHAMRWWIKRHYVSVHIKLSSTIDSHKRCSMAVVHRSNKIRYRDVFFFFYRFYEQFVRVKFFCGQNTEFWIR